MTRVLLVPGSTRDESLPAAALRTAVRFSPPEVTATVYGGLRAVEAYVPGERTPSDLRHRVETADAMLFSTPQYAGSLPGSLKNLLDWLVDAGLLAGKPVAWLSVAAPGQDEGARAMLETVLGHGRARLVRPACIRIPLSPGAVDGQGLVTDPRLHLAVVDVLRALARAPSAARQPAQPSWQAYSSLFPVVPRSDPPAGPRWPGRS